MVVICGGGGERNTNSYAVITFCVRVGAVYIHVHLSHCLSHPYTLTLIMHDQLSCEG